MSNYTWYVFVDDLSLWMQNNLKEGAKPNWDEFLNVVSPAKALLSDRAHNAIEKFGQFAASIQGYWDVINTDNMTPRAASLTRAWLMTFCVSLYVPMMFFRRGPRGAMKGGIAAFVQSTLYGGFTPAGSIFATMTTVATLGRESPIAIASAAAIASATTGVMYMVTE
ncbi:hypothetical protein CTheo_2822 [Ceratobasidium theobromae]|uniref:Transmembrane protein n=1 Tax=Ceratobasidium theobromae TaxID=1582974 RepID=A0A5N5QPP8_9AGAM|nr:hypothetical protein CTheo_2822 [Ceratobasidium theobromae]